MRLVHLLFLVTYFLAALPGAAQSAEPWIPIAPEDLAIKNVPGIPGASAIRLYYSHFRNDEKKFELRYERIKILNDAGKKYADVRIPLEPRDSLKDLKARTIRPDGSVVEFTGKPFEKTIFKARGSKYRAETFTLPEVTVGSIVEYSYALSMGASRLERVTEWQLQGELYTVKERFRFQPVAATRLVPHYVAPSAPSAQVACAYRNQVGAPIPQQGKDGLRELELKNVEPFSAEDFMPPESDYRATMLCYYGSGPMFSYLTFWPSWQKLFVESTDHFIGNPSKLREAATRTIAGETDPEQKLKKLYALAQQVRNLSYERRRTTREEKAEKLKDNSDAADVLRHGYGDRWEIDALFLGLVRSAGFDASLLMVSNRYERSFSKYILWLGQLNGLGVMVNMDGKSLFLDPGTRFCPFGMLAPRYSETTALVLKSGFEFLTTPPAPPSSIKRLVKLALSSDGSAKGQMSLEWKGPRALEERLDALDADEEARRKDLEDEVSSWLPSGAIVKMTESDGWTSSDGPLTAKFTVEMPGFASVTSKRLIVPAYLLSSLRKYMFTSDSRMYPLDFGYPFSQSDELRLQLPESYSLEELPPPRKAQLPLAGYAFSTAMEEAGLVVRRTLHVDQSLFPPEEYSRLKNFFSVAQAGDATQAVLQLK